MRAKQIWQTVGLSTPRFRTVDARHDGVVKWRVFVLHARADERHCADATVAPSNHNRPTACNLSRSSLHLLL